MSTALTATRPLGKVDANGREIYDSVDDLAFQGIYDNNDNLIYKGSARPGSSTSAAVWQICKLNYDNANNLTSIVWPQAANGAASSEYQFVWTSYASYTYS